MIRQLTRPLLRPLLRPLVGKGGCERWVYSFDGVDDYGQWDQRLIDPDGDNVIEWEQVGFNSFATSSIITQSVTSAFDQREFTARWLNGLLDVRLKGASIIGAGNAVAASDGLWKILTPASGGCQVFLNGNLVATNANNRGVFAEPSAKTVIGARNNNGSFAEFFNGQLYNIRINGQLYPINNPNSNIQLAEPSGLGEESFDFASALVIGAATKFSDHFHFNVLAAENAFIRQPLGSISDNTDYLLTFEVFDYVVGGVAENSAGFVNLGVTKNGVYTSIVNPGTSTRLTLSRIGTVCNLKIRNISLRPLGTANPLTLVNINQDRWSKIKC